MHFFRDSMCRSLLIFHGSCVSSVLESSCMALYTAVLRAILPYTHEKITIFRGAPDYLQAITK